MATLSLQIDTISEDIGGFSVLEESTRVEEEDEGNQDETEDESDNERIKRKPLKMKIILNLFQLLLPTLLNQWTRKVKKVSILYRRPVTLKELTRWIYWEFTTEWIDRYDKRHPFDDTFSIG